MLRLDCRQRAILETYCQGLDGQKRSASLVSKERDRWMVNNSQVLDLKKDTLICDFLKVQRCACCRHGLWMSPDANHLSENRVWILSMENWRAK